MPHDTMPPERWNQIRELFAAAQEVAADRRAEFLAGRCGGDDELQREVARLLALDEKASGFMEVPVARLMDGGHTSPLARPGAIVAERFRIVRSIGRGGMGEVFEAEDAVLGERVALKIMRPDVDDVEAMAGRFRREVQLSRRISHPGVCRVHDVAFQREVEGESTIVLTMELLQGESLAERLRRGAPPDGEALDLASQLAEALDAAHAQRVLHRDIKPGNVMLVPRPEGGMRAVLTDFGLARALEPGASDGYTRKGLLLGTPEYMAPELLRGGEPSVRSDLYAFALVVREMLTGVPPRRDEPVSAATTRPPAAESGRRPASTNVRAWDRVLERALSADAAHRFGSAREIVRALTRPYLGRARVMVAHPVAAAVGVAAVLALLAAGLRFYGQTKPQIGAASEIVLTDLFNGTGEAELDGAAEAMRSQLAQSPHFNIVPRDRVHERLAQMRRTPGDLATPEAAREVAMREDAPLVAYSTLSRLGQEYVVGVKIERVGARPTIVAGSWAQSFSAARKPQIFDAIRDAAIWIRRTVGEQPADLADQDRPVAETTTSSWEALRLFAKANAQHAGGNLANAALLLRQAIQLDPDFAAAHMRLADILISLKQDREGYEEWHRAIEAAEKHEITSRESLRLRGQYFEDIGDVPAAEQAFRTYAVHYPNDSIAAVFLAGTLNRLGRNAEAATWYEKGLALQPDSQAASVHLAKTYMDMGRFDLARKPIEVVRKQGHGDWAGWLDALAKFADGDVDGAIQAMTAVRNSNDVQWHSRGFTVVASWFAEMNQDDRAAAELQAGIAFDAARGLQDREADKWLHLAEIHRRTGDLQGAANAALRVAAATPTVRPLMVAGTVLARAGRIADAQRLYERIGDFGDVPRVRMLRHRLAGEILLAQARSRDALGELEKAFALAGRWENRSSLARALHEAGDVARARALATDLAEHPSRFYFGPEPELPGLWAEALSLHARILRDAGDPGTAAASARLGRLQRKTSTPHTETPSNLSR